MLRWGTESRIWTFLNVKGNGDLKVVANSVIVFHILHRRGICKCFYWVFNTENLFSQKSYFLYVVLNTVRTRVSMKHCQRTSQRRKGKDFSNVIPFLVLSWVYFLVAHSNDQLSITHCLYQFSGFFCNCSKTTLNFLLHSELNLDGSSDVQADQEL